MKRNKPKRRRDRKTGLSPYAKYNKSPFKYSWRSPHQRQQPRAET